jgi:Na+-translocating ferredoxin:NAD+ oxidoreductase RnfD subunit
MYYIIIAILTIYATYKNGIVLYNKHLIQMAAIFKPLILVIIAIGIPILIDAVHKTFIKKEVYELKQDYFPAFMGLTALCLPINISIILFLLSTIVLSIIKTFYNFTINYYSISKLLIILLLIILGKYTYMSIYDLKIETNLSTLDMFLGRGVGGIATTNILLLIICYIILCFNFTYKKEIPIISFVSYFVTLIIYSILFRSNVISNIKLLVNSEFIYGAIMIATMSFYSPVDFKSRVTFAITLGVLSFIFNLIFNIYEGVFIAIIVSNIIILIINKLGDNKNEHKRI